MNSEERICSATGAARDGAAAVEGFAQLLSSRRVGPRAVAQALTQVGEGCLTLVHALQALEDSLGDLLQAHPPAARVAHLLLSDTRTKTHALSAALLARKKETIDARARIALENLVVRSGGEISAALCLANLLAAAASARPTSLDLSDVLADHFRAADAIGGSGKAAPTSRLGRSLHVAVHMDGPVLLTGDSRVVSELIEFAVAHVAQAGAQALSLVAADHGGRIVLRVEPASDPGRRHEGATRTALFRFREMVPLASEIARAAANLCSITLDIDTSSPAVTIVL